MLSDAGRATTDHPRIRGEHGGVDHLRDIRGGSSPHTRGAPSEITAVSLRNGIIPAYAGSTSTIGPTPTTAADHPRIRGEHLPKPPAKTGSVGSSPHTRGAR